MSKLIIAALLICLSVASAFAQDHFEVKVGKMFTVTLESNASTGYSWEIAEPLDETKVKLVESLYNAAKTDRVGAAGVELWVFKAVGAGETTISMKYVRPWEKDAAPAETATFAVTIK
jgi:inhibitor of cysteine peptidase